MDRDVGRGTDQVDQEVLADPDLATLDPAALDPVARHQDRDRKATPSRLTSERLRQSGGCSIFDQCLRIERPLFFLSHSQSNLFAAVHGDWCAIVLRSRKAQMT